MAESKLPHRHKDPREWTHEEEYTAIFNEAQAEQPRKQPFPLEELAAAERVLTEVRTIFDEHLPVELTDDFIDELEEREDDALERRRRALERLARAQAISAGRRSPRENGRQAAINAERKRVADEIDRLLREMGYGEGAVRHGDEARAIRDLRRAIRLRQRRADITIEQVTRRAVRESLARIRSASSSTT